MYKPYAPEYNRSRIHLTPGQMCTNQKGVYVVKNTRRDATPQKDVKEMFHPQFPVQMQHIRLNQLEENYSSQYQINTVDMTPQRSIQKHVQPVKPQSSTSQLHHSNDSQVNRINVNLSLKQFQQHPLKQINQNSGQKTPIAGSSHKQFQPPVYVGEDPQRNLSKLSKENNQHYELQQQLNDIRRQKENICITLSETFKKNQALTARIQELTQQLNNQRQSFHEEHQKDIECLQEKVIELTNANNNLSTVSSQYSIKVQQLESQLKSQKQIDNKKISDLSDEVNRLIQAKDEITDELKNLRKNRNEVLEMNRNLELELREAANLNTQLKHNLSENTIKRPKNEELHKQASLSLTAHANHLNPSYSDSMETDSSFHQTVQVAQLTNMIEMLKTENTILYTALQQR